MAKFKVIVRRTIEEEVEVEADSIKQIRDDWDTNGMISSELLEAIDDSFNIDTEIEIIGEKEPGKKFRWYPAKHVGYKTWSHQISNPVMFTAKQQKTAERKKLQCDHGELYMDLVQSGVIIETYIGEATFVEDASTGYKKIIEWRKI